jgi:outer membrane protein assembly factor BamB
MKCSAALATSVLFLSAAVCTYTQAAPGDDFWPTWRGPQATGAALKGNPPITWSKTENVKWKVELPGKGQSSPVIWENKIFFQTAIDTGKAGTAESQPAQPEQPAAPARGGRGGPGGAAPKTIYKFDMVCMDRATGKILWQKTAAEAMPHEGHQETGSFAAYSPITDGKRVWASFGSRGLYCYDMDGNLKWSKPLVRMTIKMGFGEGSSPCLAGDAIIVVCDHEAGSVIFAFNKETGDLIWKKDRDEKTTWATPVVAEANGKLQIITNGTAATRSYDAKTGDLIWQCTGQTPNAIPTGLVAFDMAYCISGFKGSALQALRLDRTGDLTGTDGIVWQMKDGTPYVPSPVLMGERLFFIGDGGNKALVSCYNAKTGKALYSKQAIPDMKLIYASFVGVGDRIYVADRSGTVAVVKNADTFEVLATNKLDDGIDATPAIVGDELYLRGNKYFYCIAKK